MIPRNIINRFTCTFNGRPVFACDIEPAIAANPYLEFSARVEESGTFRFTWAADDGAVITASEKITVRGWQIREIATCRCTCSCATVRCLIASSGPSPGAESRSRIRPLPCHGVPDLPS